MCRPPSNVCFSSLDLRTHLGAFRPALSVDHMWSDHSGRMLPSLNWVSVPARVTVWNRNRLYITHCGAPRCRPGSPPTAPWNRGRASWGMAPSLLRRSGSISPSRGVSVSPSRQWSARQWAPETGETHSCYLCLQVLNLITGVIFCRQDEENPAFLDKCLMHMLISSVITATF